MKYFVIAVIVIVAAAIVYGFVLVGSPREERLREFDVERVNDLALVQGRILNFWQAKKTLPATLANLGDSLSGTNIPADPETSQPYEYIVKDAAGLSFELCATFDRESGSVSPSIAYPGEYFSDDNWQHGAGRVCFDRTIDAQLYGTESGHTPPRPASIPVR